MNRVRHFIAKLDPYLLLLLALSGFAIAPLLAPGYFYGAHDGRHSVFYLGMFDASIRDGALWPRWAMHHIQGYGYPTFIIQAPMGFYVAEFFILLGAGYTLAAKLTWAGAFLASGWGMYRLVVHLLRGETEELGEDRQGLDPVRTAALVAGLLYVYAPYHLVDIYVRGALNDTLLLAWFPWVLLAFDRLIAQGTAPGWTRRLAVAMLLLAGTLLTHTFALISFTPLLITFVLFRLGMAWLHDRRAGEKAGRALFWRTLLAGAGGVGALLLYAVFLLPLLAEGPHLQQQVYVADTYNYRNHFVYFSQFLSPFWGFGFSDDPTGAKDGMSFQLGALMVVLLMAAVYTLIHSRGRRLMARGHAIYFVVATLGLLLVMTPLSAPLWDAIPGLGIIQFPWRLLALAALALAALGGLTVANLLAMRPYASGEFNGAFALMLLIVFASFGYIGADMQPVEAWREDGRADYRFEREHPDMIAYTEWVQEPFTETPMTADYAAEDYSDDRGRTDKLTRLAIIQGPGQVISQWSAGSSGGGVVRMETPGVVRIHYLYFPGWQVRIDGQPADYRVSDPTGAIEVDVPAGEHEIEARMGSTPARRAGATISWAMLLVALGLLVWPVRKGETGRFR
jgi:hypothetical protein